MTRPLRSLYLADENVADLINNLYASGKLTAQALSTGPPSNPSDGDIWIATGVDSNGTIWQFRYNLGSSSSYKWEFLGGPPMIATVASASTLDSASYTDPTSGTTGPAIALTRPGDYLISGVATGQINTAAADTIGVAYALSGGTTYSAADVDGAIHLANDGQMNTTLCFAERLHTGLGANTTVTMKYRNANTNASSQWTGRRLLVLPVRVS